MKNGSGLYLKPASNRLSLRAALVASPLLLLAFSFFPVDARQKSGY